MKLKRIYKLDVIVVFKVHKVVIIMLALKNMNYFESVRCHATNEYNILFG